MTQNPTWWLTGVVLEIEGCRILIRGEVKQNRVEILVAGTTGRRAALSVVRDYFRTVHGHFARLDAKERVPLPDQPKLDVSYKHLVQLEQDEGSDHVFRPEDAVRKYTVRELLEGMRDDTPRAVRNAAGRDARSSATEPPAPLQASASVEPPAPPAAPHAGASSDRSALIAAIITAALLTAYAAWVLYAPPTRAMLLPTVFGGGFIFVWARRKSAFYRRAFGTLLGLATVGAAVPAVAVVAEVSGFRIDARLSGSSGGFAIVCIIGALLFGILEYLDRTAGTPHPRFDSRSILFIVVIIVVVALLAGAAGFAFAARSTSG